MLRLNFYKNRALDFNKFLHKYQYLNQNQNKWPQTSDPSRSYKTKNEKPQHVRKANRLSLACVLSINAMKLKIG